MEKTTGTFLSKKKCFFPPLICVLTSRLPDFLTSWLNQFLHSCMLEFLTSFLPEFPTSLLFEFLTSLLPYFLTSCLPDFLPSCPPDFRSQWLPVSFRPRTNARPWLWATYFVPSSPSIDPDILRPQKSERLSGFPPARRSSLFLHKNGGKTLRWQLNPRTRRPDHISVSTK